MIKSLTKENKALKEQVNLPENSWRQMEGRAPPKAKLAQKCTLTAFYLIAQKRDKSAKGLGKNSGRAGVALWGRACNRSWLREKKAGGRKCRRWKMRRGCTVKKWSQEGGGAEDEGEARRDE